MSRHTILLVEDNPDDEALTLRALRRNNADIVVEIARDGAEALHYLHGDGGDQLRWPKPLPKVVLLDLKLPRVDGLEVLRQIREHAHTRTLPVVVLTSSDEDRDLIESYRLGCNSYVCKPVDYDEFLEAARQLGLFWLLLNRTPPER
jgi:two-component system response regulator